MNIYMDDRQEIKITEEIFENMKLGIRKVLIYEDEDLESEISISLVGKEEIRSLNRDFRGVDQVTDVLSFPLGDDFQFAMPMLGDIILCVERAVEQAEEYNHSLMREIVYLTVHSTLHLLGYDHIEEEDRTVMREKEEVIMNKIEVLR